MRCIHFLFIVEVFPARLFLSFGSEAPVGRAGLGAQNLQAGKFQHRIRKAPPADIHSCGGRAGAILAVVKRMVAMMQAGFLYWGCGQGLKDVTSDT